ncbi:hypothetical protein [Planctomyces sp. SH-PL14]|uniref:hypothetical protein n=1 Tax=Planctomyces sp. SH-PL14 TaxID=1632864 RepID=UPI00078E5DA1|nr:hypothetical protein [Planctomyces sp. SH-PL14]AMV19995.1 hypothetical protein VT03_19005 [Planctomyces sp. SH-PL14]
MPRLLLTVATAICLVGVYRIYALIVTPLVTPVEQGEVRPPVMMASGAKSSASSDLAREFLPNSAWAQEAKMCWQQSEDACIFFNDHQRLQDGGNKLRLAPYAMVWRDPKRTDGGRYTIEAEGAIVSFQNEFFDEAVEFSRKPGRIVHLTLEGKVRLTGPDNLAIEGEKFIFSEESAQLYSDWPVTFRYGPAPGQSNAVRGQADQLTVEFIKSTTSDFGPDMPRVGGLSRVRLRRAVQFDMTYELNGALARTLVTSDGPFLFHYPEKRIEFEENVSVVRPQIIKGVKHIDSLKAHWLGLQFVEADAPPAEGSGETKPAVQPASGTKFGADSSMLSKIQFRYLRALGREEPGKPVVPLHLESTSNQFAADLQDLRYDAQTRDIALIDPVQVRMQHGATRLYSPLVRVRHGQQGQPFEAIDCEGEGQFEQLDEALERPMFVGSWKERVHVAPDTQSPGNILTIQGNASLAQPGRFQLESQAIQVWLEPTASRGQPGAAGLAGSALPNAARKLPVRRAVAQGGVRMATPEVVVLTNLADARFSAGEAAPRPGRGGPDPAGDGNPRQMPGAREEQPPFIVNADRIEAHVVRDPRTQAFDARELIGEGGIHITREALERGAAAAAGPPNRIGGDGPVDIQGHRLQMTNTGGSHGHIITLAGMHDPRTNTTRDATLQFGDYRVEAAVLTFDRSRNAIEVPGPGRLNMPVSSDLRGGKTDRPQIMNVVWLERMTFDGQTAKFFERVKTQLGHSLLLCEAMDVALNRKIDFTSDHPDTKGLELKTVDCRHKVVVETYDYADSRLIEVLKGNLAEFHVDNATGEFSGLGPGTVQDWRISKGGSSRLLSLEPTTTAKANQPVPAREDKRFPWEYVKLEFKGNVTGNLKRQDATFRRSVQVLYAPVAQALQVFQRADLSPGSGKDNANNAAWLGCRELDIMIATKPDGEPSAQLRAEGGDGEDAWLEGQKFTANGHEVIYDQAKDQFILRGRGKDKADIHFQDQPGQAQHDVNARVIQFVPSRREVILDGAGVSGQAN